MTDMEIVGLGDEDEDYRDCTTNIPTPTYAKTSESYQQYFEYYSHLSSKYKHQLMVNIVILCP
jgi:hypothetical protein